MNEGDIVNPGPEGKVIVAVVRGKARHVLLGERTALNILTRASGIATEVSRLSSIWDVLDFWIVSEKDFGAF